jgi:hypothetical protein
MMKAERGREQRKKCDHSFIDESMGTKKAPKERGEGTLKLDFQ